MSKLIDKALKFATHHHGVINHRRKYTNEPYINHPIAVAATVKNYGGTAAMIAASLLHDTCEDTDATLDEIKEEFGVMVYTYVGFLTDVATSEDGNRATRMMINNRHIENAPAAVHTIKLADIYDNVKSIVKHDQKFAITYLEEKKIALMYIRKGNTVLYNIVHSFLKENISRF